MIKVQAIHVYAGVGLAVAVLAISILAWIATSRQNQQSLRTQEVIAHFETQDAFDYLKGQTRLMIYWQDAFDKIVRNWDQAWVGYQFGPYEETMGNHLVAIVGPKRDLRFLHAAGYEQTFTPDNFMHANGLDALLRATRRAGVQQPPPIPQGVIVVDGKPYFAVAAFITPERESDLPAARQTPFTVLFMKPVTLAEYGGFAAGFENASVVISNKLTPGETHYALNDAEGRPVGYVQWKPRLPGDVFLRSVILPIAAVLILLITIQFLVVRRWLRLQKRLIRAEADSAAAHEQSRLKSVFLGTISHELRTPLNAIIGYADVLCCQIFGPLGSPRNAEYVRDIRDSGRKLLGAVNDLIEIARIEAGDTGSTEDMFDPASAVRHAVSSARRFSQPKDISIVLRTPKKAGWCKGSLISLSQALERILDNAVRHSQQSGTVTVEVRTTDDQVVIEVRDRGDGIPAERLAELTRPFALPDNYLIASGNKGLGFGIPIARGLVELMHGTFEIQSEPEIGTTVRIRLPLHTPKQEPSQEAEPSEPFSTSGVIWTGRGRDFVARRIADGP